MAAFNPAQLELLQEMKELLNSMTKRLDRMSMGMNQQHETMIKKIDSVLTPVTRTDLVEDEEIEALLSDDGEVTEGSKPDLISTDDFQVEVPSSILAEEVVSETRVFGTAKNHQLGAVPNHGQIVDRISKILTERGAATSPSLASTKKKKKKTSFVKDRGKTPTLQRRGRRPWKINGKVRRKTDQNPSNARLLASASASEKKKTEEVAVVKDRGKPCVAVQTRGRRGSMTAARYHGSNKGQGGGCEEAWSRRVAMKHQSGRSGRPSSPAKFKHRATWRRRSFSGTGIVVCVLAMAAGLLRWSLKKKNKKLNVKGDEARGLQKWAT